MVKKILIVISGPSGSGKTTLQRMLCENLGASTIVSLTTRKPRANEIDGVHYDFISHDEMRRLHSSGELIEHIEYAGNEYGMSVGGVNRALEKSGIAIVVQTPQGMRDTRRYAQEHGLEFLSVFVGCPRAVLQARMQARLDNGEITQQEFLRRNRLVDIDLREMLAEAARERYDLHFALFAAHTEGVVCDKVAFRVAVKQGRVE